MRTEAALNARRIGWVAFKAGVSGGLADYERQRPELAKKMGEVPWYKREFEIIKAVNKGQIAKAALRSATLAGAREALENEQPQRTRKPKSTSMVFAAA